MFFPFFFLIIKVRKWHKRHQAVNAWCWLNCYRIIAINKKIIKNEDANNKKEKENVNTISTLGKNARLVNNIDMSEIDDWTSIGTKTKKFTGIFDNTNFEYKSDNPDDENNQEEFIISGIDKKDLFIYDNSEAKIHVKVEGNYLCVPEENSELTKFLEGAGTVESPYLIKTADDLIYMRDTINKGMDGIIRNLNVEGTIKKVLHDSNGDGKVDVDKNMFYLGTLVGNNYGNNVNCNIGGKYNHRK